MLTKTPENKQIPACFLLVVSRLLRPLFLEFVRVFFGVGVTLCGGVACLFGRASYPSARLVIKHYRGYLKLFREAGGAQLGVETCVCAHFVVHWGAVS